MLWEVAQRKEEPGKYDVDLGLWAFHEQELESNAVEVNTKVRVSMADSGSSN